MRIGHERELMPPKFPAQLPSSLRVALRRLLSPIVRPRQDRKRELERGHGDGLSRKAKESLRGVFRD